MWLERKYTTWLEWVKKTHPSISHIWNQEIVSTTSVNFINEEVVEKLLFDYQVSLFKIKILKLLPAINNSKEADDLKEPLIELMSMNIPVLDYVNQEKRDKIIAYVSSLSQEKNRIQTWTTIKTIESLLNIDNEALQRLISKWLPEDSKTSLYNKNNSIVNLLEDLKEEIETVMGSIVDKVISIFEYNEILIKSKIDELTWIWNRAAFEAYWKEEFEKIKENPENKLAIICLDIDRFKCINDRYLHSWWDLVLKEIARVLEKVLWNYEWNVFRIWWEEFAVLLPNSDEGKSIEVAELIAKELWKIDLREEKTNISYEITWSMWIAIADNNSKYEKIWEVVKDADYRSYRAKRGWRNRREIKWESTTVEKSNKWNLILNMDENDIDYNKVLKAISDKLQRFIATLVVQKTKIEEDEPISSLWPIDWTYRQVAYLVKHIFENHWFGDFEWLKTPLNNFIGDNWIEIWSDRFSDINYFIEKWKISEIKEMIKANPIENKCSDIHLFMNLINTN